MLHWKTCTAPLLAALSFVLSGCLYPPFPERPVTPLEEAARYDWLIAERRYSEPVNAWVRNKPLERFLLKAYSSGGLDALKSQYGFDCAPRAIVPPCANCQTCRAAPRIGLSAQELNSGLSSPANVVANDSSPPMLIEIEIGPGAELFNVITYWGRPVRARQ